MRNYIYLQLTEPHVPRICVRVFPVCGSYNIKSLQLINIKCIDTVWQLEEVNYENIWPLSEEIGSWIFVEVA